MQNLILDLPEGLRTYVEEQAVAQGLGTAEAYVVSVLSEDRQQKAKARLEALLVEGINSGPAVEMDAKEWADIRREVRERIEHARTIQ